jgi:hypothetical protein
MLVPKLAVGDMVHRSHDGKLVRTLGQAGQILAKANARQFCLRCTIFATNRVGGIRLGIESLVLGWSTRLEDEDDRFRLGPSSCCWRRLGFKP